MNATKLARLPETLFEIGKAIGGSDNSSTLFARISELVCSLTSADACSIMLLDESNQRLLGRAAHGLSRRDIGAVSFQLGEGVAGWVCQTGDSALIHDVTRDPRYKQLPDSQNAIRSLACVPLDCRDGRVGVVTITSAKHKAFEVDDVELLGFIAKTMALDMENMRLRRSSMTDALTGVFNREFLQQRLPRAIEHAISHDEPLSIAMVDVDHFKAVNDTHGHAAGDAVLGEVALRLLACVRKEDRIVRFGGEEFLAILPRTTGKRAFEIGERMRKRFERSAIALGEVDLSVTVSVGIAELRQNDTDASLMERADAALYQAKSNGRNRVEIAGR